MSPLTFSNLTENWSCHLQCDRCQFRKPNGEQCKNRVCFGSPVCWIHNRKNYGVQIKNSTIEGAGKGLFATKNIRFRDWICPVGGEQLQENCIDQRYPGDDLAPYAVTRGSDGVVFDAACVRGIGSMSNALFTPAGNPRNRKFHNSKMAENPNDNNALWIQATKNIASGEEIFTFYGDEYTLDDVHETRRFRSVDTRPC